MDGIEYDVIKADHDSNKQYFSFIAAGGEIS